MLNSIETFIISIGASTLAVLWFGAVLAYDRSTPLVDIVTGAILATVVFILIALILGLVFWGAAYALFGKQTRESLRYCFAGTAFLGAVLFSIFSTYDLWDLGARRGLSNFAILAVHLVPYYLVWISASIWFRKKQRP